MPPTAVLAAGESLLLTRSMRGALLSAVRALLEDPRLAGARDVVRLAVVVLLAKAPATSSRVLVRYRDLAGWLGCSISYVGHTVVPALKEAGVVTGEADRDKGGRTSAVVLDLLPLREARAASATHPLALLNRRDLATLLRLCEVVTCPGWSPVGGPETPAGFMAFRRGRDAATDRLAMVLLVLNARSDGRVRMAPGRVAEGFGRADATVARLLGCPVEAGAKVVERLVGMGVVDFERPERWGRGRLRVPAVAEAYARARMSSVPQASEECEVGEGGAGGCPRCAGSSGAAEADGEGPELVLAGDGWAQESFDDVLAWGLEGAFRDQEGTGEASSQVGSGLGGVTTADGCAEPHADHSPVVDVHGVGAADRDCFSGSAVLGCDDHRERAGAGEDQVDPCSAAALGAGEVPLRGEERDSPPPMCDGSGRSAFVGRVGVPDDLREVLAPVAWLWAGLERESTSRWLARAVRLELSRLRGVVGVGPAERALTERLQRRLDRQRAQPVQDLAGWLLHRGLPQRTECWSEVCDDGVRMDTGGACESCACRVGDRRSLRQAVAADIAARHPQLSREARRPLYEQELRARVELQAAHDLARRERAAREQAQSQQAVEEQRARIAQEEAARAMVPCRQCGLPEAGGLCLGCTLQESTRKVVEEAVDIVLALRADFADPQAVASLAEQIERDTWADVRRVEVSCDYLVVRADAECERARRLLEQRRREALVSLGESPAARAEALHVQRMALRHIWPVTEKARADATRAAHEARARVAHELLVGHLAKLRRFRSESVPRPARRPWSQRLAELAAQPLEAAASGSAR
ncbi:hypothetical protein ACGRHY_29035 [Streptomyces sp. HK10]|uniref:hypothetical protein n=1 Tax=Streptomyces sp. HK10 TaxID=3373255 RepID=UPI00374795F7